MALKTVDITNHADWYSTRRDELLNLLDATAQLDVPSEYKKEFTDIHKKCLENQFEIVLVGEFQGGKSTTFNTLCGGRELSPRCLNGGGIKTSAAVISAQNISDGEVQNGREEWAEITFKSKKELLSNMFDVLVNEGQIQTQFPKLKWETESDFLKNLDLDNAAHRKVMLDTVLKLWTARKDMGNSDLLDNMRIATLILKFYGTPEYKKLCEKKITDVVSFQNLIQFPQGWEVKWGARENAKFTFDEIAFVFISRVLLRIKSPHLARLGCRITDCPGLFANSYDTRVAKAAIHASDAVWYLLNGDKQAGESDIKILSMLQKEEIRDRQFISANMKENHTQKIQNIIPTSIALLQNNGLKSDVNPYNARLALLSEQGQMILDGTLSDHDKKIMEDDFGNGPQPPEIIWRQMVNKIGWNVNVQKLCNLASLDENAIQAVKDESRLENILSAINQRIIKDKSQSILLDNGSVRAAKALKAYEGELQSREDAARQSKEQAEKEKAEADRKMEEFQKASLNIIDESPFVAQKNINAKYYAGELIREAFSDEILRNKITEKLVDCMWNTYSFWKLWTSDNAFKNDVMNAAGPYVSARLNDALIQTWQKWKDKTNTFCEWQGNYLKSIAKTNRKIEEKWRDVKCDEINLLKGLGDFVVVYNPPDIAIQTIGENANMRDAIDEANCNVFTTIWDIIKTILSRGCREDIFKERIRPIVKKAIADVLRNVGFFSDTQDGLARSFRKYSEQVEDNLLNKLKLVQDAYEKRKKEKDAIFKEKQADQQKIAKEANATRTQKIEPVRKEIEEFQQQVTKEIRQVCK